MQHRGICIQAQFREMLASTRMHHEQLNGMRTFHYCRIAANGGRCRHPGQFDLNRGILLSIKLQFTDIVGIYISRLKVREFIIGEVEERN